MEGGNGGGMFTPQQREAAKNDFETEEQDADDAAKKRMYTLRMRRRAARTLKHDAELLLEYIDPKQVEDELAGGDAVEGSRHLVAWLYRVLDAAGADPEAVIKDGMSQARGDRLDRILEKLQETPGEVTMDEIEMLQQSGYIDEDDHVDLFKQWLGNAGELDADAILDAVQRPHYEEPDDEPGQRQCPHCEKWFSSLDFDSHLRVCDEADTD